MVRTEQAHGRAACLGQTRKPCLYFALRDPVASCCVGSAISSRSGNWEAYILGLLAGKDSTCEVQFDGNMLHAVKFCLLFESVAGILMFF